MRSPQIAAGDSAWAAENYYLARIAYERALRDDSTSVRALYRLGILASWDGLLDSALARPVNQFLYEKVNDLAGLAAAYGFGIAKNHAFVDGIVDAHEAASGGTHELPQAGSADLGVGFRVE